MLRIAFISSFLLAPVSAQSNANFNLLIASPSLDVLVGKQPDLDNAGLRCRRLHATGVLNSKLAAGGPKHQPSLACGWQPVCHTDRNCLALDQSANGPGYHLLCQLRRNSSATFSIAVALPEPEKHWVASWGASAVVPSNASGAYYLTNVTVRQIAHLSLGAASSLRIRLSNALGKAAVSFASIHVAQWAGNPSNPTSAILPATDRIVTFFGSATITVAGGCRYFQRPRLFAFAGGFRSRREFLYPQDVSNVPATMHTFGNQKAYFALGDSPASPVIPNAVTDTVRPYLTGVEVEASDASAVVALGDSLTDGMFWPEQLVSSPRQSVGNRERRHRRKLPRCR